MHGLKSNLSLLASLLAAGPGLVTAALVPQQRFIRMSKAIEECYRQQYDSSWNLISALVSEDTTDPAAAYWQASLVQMLCYETGDKAMIDSFHKLNDRVEGLSLRRTGFGQNKDTLAYLYLGLARLNRANSLAWEQKRVEALQALVPAMAPLRTALSLESTLADAKYGLGMIEYFRAQGDKYLLGLGILGSKQRAFELVREAAACSGLCNVSARFSLAWMLGQEHEYAEALSQCASLLQAYPDNRSVLRTMRDILFSKGDYDTVLTIGRCLEAGVCKSFPGNKYYLAENWLKMARAWAALGQAESSLVLLDKIIAWEEYRDRVPWLGTYVTEAKALRKDICH